MYTLIAYCLCLALVVASTTFLLSTQFVGTVSAHFPSKDKYRNKNSSSTHLQDAMMFQFRFTATDFFISWTNHMAFKVLYVEGLFSSNIARETVLIKLKF